MTKKFRIFELDEQGDWFKVSEKTVILTFPKDNYHLLGVFDSLQEAEDAIERYGYDYVNYIIQPIYRTDGD
jgi:hypothetical protein